MVALNFVGLTPISALPFPPCLGPLGLVRALSADLQHDAPASKGIAQASHKGGSSCAALSVSSETPFNQWLARYNRQH